MLAVATPLPDAMVRLVPYIGQVLKHFAFQIPRPFIEFQLGHARLMKRVDQLAIDI